MVASASAYRSEPSFQLRHVAAWTVAFTLHIAALMELWGHHPAPWSPARSVPEPIMAHLVEPPPLPAVPPEPVPPTHTPPPKAPPVHRALPVPMATPVQPAAPLSPMSQLAPNPTAVALPTPGPALPSVPDAPPTELAYNGPPRIKYPVAALRARQSGLVTLTVHVSADGVPLSVQVKRSSGVRALDDAAIAGVKTWRFKPATRSGATVEGDAEVSVAFKPDA